MINNYKWNSKVLPHGELIKLDNRLWYLTGSLPLGNIPRNMVVYKLKSGGILIHSAVALNEDTMSDIENIGKPEYLIVPNKFHRLDASLYRDMYHDIKVICPAGIRNDVEKKVPVDYIVEDIAQKLGITYYNPEGFRTGELIYELDIDSGKALVFCDLLFNLEHFGGISGWLLRIIGSTGFFGTTKIGRLMMKDKPAVKKLLLKLSETDNLKYILVAHGRLVSEQCNMKLREAASF